MTDPITRNLIQRLADALHNAIRVVYHEDGTQHIDTARPVLAEAHAYLAQPEPRPPTDEELISTYQSTYAPAWDRGEYHGCHVDGLHAVLARYGNRTPAENQSIETSNPWKEAVLNALNVEFLLNNKNQDDPKLAIQDLTEFHWLFGGPSESAPANPPEAELYDLAEKHNGEPVAAMRAALRLYGNRTPVPIPLSERHPTEADCDAKGRCWFGAPDRPGAVACWDLESEPATDDTHWLPHWALPVPKQI